ncbi:MAG: class I SAM-dependent methyltransferase [Bacteroidales bacterium]
MVKRIDESDTFLKAYNNRPARTMVKTMLIDNYTRAVLLHHPKDKLSFNLINQKCSRMIDYIFDRIEEVKYSPEKLFPLFERLSRNNSRRDDIWFCEFIESYENYKHNVKLIRRYDQIKDFLKGNSFCDVGCGGGDLAFYVKKHSPAISMSAGIDVVDWRTEGLKKEIDFLLMDLSSRGTVSSRQFDTVTCLAVLHHISSGDEAVNVFLSNLKSALSKTSTLIIEEDVLITREIQDSHEFVNDIEILKTNQIYFNNFIALNEKDQKAVLILIDFLANCLSVGVPQMAFPCGFRSIENWIDLFTTNLYKVDEVRIHGFIPGNFNQSAHATFVLSSCS